MFDSEISLHVSAWLPGASMLESNALAGLWGFADVQCACLAMRYNRTVYYPVDSVWT
jgi:hypothetical protein